MFREGIEQLSGPFERLPQAFAGLMVALFQEYMNACQQAGIGPDGALLGPIVAQLQRLQR